MKQFRVGLVGCGGIAQVHSRVLTKMDNVRFVACADIKKERAQALSETYGPTPYGSLEEMLEKEPLDALHICTPHYLHTPMAMLAAEKGLAVFTEKPPVISLEQWEQLRTLEKKIPVGVCFQNRYLPCFIRAQELIRNENYGKVLGARGLVTWCRTKPYYLDSGWRGTWKTEGGGALINQCIHTMDLMLEIMGKPEVIEANMENHHLRGDIEVEDTVNVYFRFNGRPGYLMGTTSYCKDEPVLIEFACENATLRLESNKLYILKDGEMTSETFEMPETLGKGYWGNGHTPCIGDFYESIEKGRPFRNDLSSVENTVFTLCEVYRQGRAQLEGK